ncbi:MAG: tannase/feruloyl esterase family alpha/beta hydrolase [Acidobacteriota bacterium]|nr:tannase/feruloyl esterase family alpha/beta hydrolase [Acidobacteriota bacterium]
MKPIWPILVVSTNMALVAGTPQVKCDALAAQSFGDEVKISSATLVPAKGNLPEHCDVRGTIWPEAGFAIKLPSEWNDRFQMVGNGGTAGTISLGPVDNAVRKGFAASSTDTGHNATKEPLATFAYVTPENPNGHRKLIDFAYLSVHETAALSKRVIQAYYGAAPKYSYWVGCSTGGRQGLQEAQRYPDDFDGLVIGAPGVSLTGNVTRRLWIGQAQVGAGAIPAEKLPVLTKAIYEKCDALDGLKDGLIDDPRACPFDAARDVAKCAGADGPDCFTSAQIDALKKIYGGPRDSKGRQIFPGELVGSEPVWPDNFIPPSKTVLPRSESQMKLAMLNPPPGPSWDFTMFNFDTDPQKVAEAAAILNPQNPDLAPLKKRGGKIVQYAGWADQQVNPQPGIDYYNAVSKRLGAAETRDFYRMFMVPGMFHCNGGPGCGSVDWLTVVMDWVEQGKAPAQIVGAHVENGKTTRTRPLCPFPQVARYKGTGSIDEATSFACLAP